MTNYFSDNLKYVREKKGISKNKLGEMVGVNQSTIGRWEAKEITPSIDNVEEVSKILNVPLPDLLIKDLRFDNGEFFDVNSNVIKIPVLGTIKAGIPIESQEDIIDYIDIPTDWIKGGKKFYGLKISGNSMYPKYSSDDIVIFEQNDDLTLFNGKDCAIMINGTESTFKKLIVSDNGIILQAYNSEYQPMIYSKEQVATLPIKVVGIAKEKRTKIE